MSWLKASSHCGRSHGTHAMRCYVAFNRLCKFSIQRLRSYARHAGYVASTACSIAGLAIFWNIASPALVHSCTLCIPHTHMPRPTLSREQFHTSTWQIFPRLGGGNIRHPFSEVLSWNNRQKFVNTCECLYDVTTEDKGMQQEGAAAETRRLQPCKWIVNKRGLKAQLGDIASRVITHTASIASLHRPHYLRSAALLAVGTRLKKLNELGMQWLKYKVARKGSEN